MQIQKHGDTEEIQSGTEKTNRTELYFFVLFFCFCRK